MDAAAKKATFQTLAAIGAAVAILVVGTVIVFTFF